MHTRNRAGKAVLKVDAAARVLPAVPVSGDDALLACANSDGRLLVFPVAEVPELPRGKGNKLFGIPAKKAESREELLTGLAVLRPDQDLLVWSGDRRMTLKAAELKDYRGERAQRGAVLPRGWRKVDRLEPA